MNGMLQGLTESFKTVLFRHALFSLGSVALVVFVKGPAVGAIWAVGFIWGFTDMFLMFRGVRKGMGQTGEESLQEMHRTLLKRLAFAIMLVIVMLKLKLSVFGIFMGFILSHIFLLLSLIIIAGRKRR
ncbi:MAG: hypothetical protein GX084_04255 [Acholeplasmataceae bacterium]|nr:hypothetical protein [Acholeplasmataceae bacterium]